MFLKAAQVAPADHAEIQAAAMDEAAFVQYAQEVLFGEGAEPLFEQIAEYEGECAMFGDAGPGTGLSLAAACADYNRIGYAYAKLTDSYFRPVGFRGPR